MTKPLTKTQQRLLDTLLPGELIRYWPPGFGNAFFMIVRADGKDYRRIGTPEFNRIPYTTVPALVDKGALVLHREFKADATGRKGYEYRKPEAPTP